MNINKMTLPYPVLGISDDILPKPVFGDVSCSQTNGLYVFEFEVMVDNAEILSLIRGGCAEYVCEVHCQRTFLRKCYKQDTPKFKIEIPQNGVSEKIEFDVTVTVQTPIANYTNAGFHEDYKGFSFDLEKGDLLAYVGSFSYDVDIFYDKLKAVGSFMEIENNNKEGTQSSVFLEGDKISIRLSPEMFEEYKDLRIDGKKASIIHSSIVFNALLQALYCYGEYSNRLWARTLAYRIKTEEQLTSYRNIGDDANEMPFDKMRIYELAQALLGDPYQRMFNCLGDFNNFEEED